MSHAAHLTILLGLAASAATTAWADPPPQAFFEGRYRAVGKTAALPPVLIDEDMRLEPQGGGFVVMTCEGPEGRLGFDAIFEVENFLSGTIKGWPVWCLYNNNGGNYPILNCGTDDGALFTLFPDDMGFGEGLRCGDGAAQP